MNKLWSALNHHASTKPDEIAILRFDKALHGVLSWRALRDEVAALAARLAEDGVQVLALQAGNSAAWIIADIACSLQDIALLPLPSFFSATQIQHALHSLHIDAVLSDQEQLLLSLSDTQFLRAGQLHGLAYLRANPAQAARDNAALLPPSTCKITFTSGSTGTPKGVCLSTQHLQAVTSALLDATAACDINRHLCVLPLASLLENIAGVHAPLRRGAQVVVADEASLGFNGASGFALPTFLRALSLCRPNSMILIPQLLDALVSSCDAGWRLPDSLAFVAVGGATVSPALLERAWAHGLPAYEGYGLSECGSVVSLNTPLARKNGSLGRVLGHTQVDIVDGEIMVKGPAFLGYVGARDSWSSVRGAQAFATGDLAYVDDDGYLHYQGRRKNLLVTSYGRNISPEWVEAELNAEVEIAFSSVFGDSRPYCVALLATPQEGISDARIQAALERANERLPAYARVQRWLRLPSPSLHANASEEGLLTSNGRPRREHIYRRFQHALEELYTTELSEKS